MNFGMSHNTLFPKNDDEIKSVDEQFYFILCKVCSLASYHDVIMTSSRDNESLVCNSILSNKKQFWFEASHFSAQSLPGNSSQWRHDDVIIGISCKYVKMSNEFGHFASGSLKKRYSWISKIYFSIIKTIKIISKSTTWRIYRKT